MEEGGLMEEPVLTEERAHTELTEEEAHTGSGHLMEQEDPMEEEKVPW